MVTLINEMERSRDLVSGRDCNAVDRGCLVVLVCVTGCADDDPFDSFVVTGGALSLVVALLNLLRSVPLLSSDRTSPRDNRIVSAFSVAGCENAACSRLSPLSTSTSAAATSASAAVSASTFDSCAASLSFAAAMPSFTAESTVASVPSSVLFSKSSCTAGFFSILGNTSPLTVPHSSHFHISDCLAKRCLTGLLYSSDPMPSAFVGRNPCNAINMVRIPQLGDHDS